MGRIPTSTHGSAATCTPPCCPAQYQHPKHIRQHLRIIRNVSLNAGGPSSPVGIEPPDIRKLAQMAQIAVTDQQVEEWAPKLGSIVEWFGQLQQVDVQGIDPAIHGSQSSSPLRADEPRAYADVPALMAQAPSLEKSYVKVPKVGPAPGEAVPGKPAASSASPAAAAPTSASPAGAASSSGSGGTSSSSSAPAAVAPAAGVAPEVLQALDIRVGRIVSCQLHPDAESLYVEKIDVGEPEPRTVVSGLVKYVPLEQMQGRMVAVICNLKARNMRGIKSSGMVLAASDEGKANVQPLAPPEGAKPGERVWFGDVAQQASPAAPNAMEKKKHWEVVQPLLTTDASYIASCQGQAMMTSAGPLKSTSLVGARIA